MPSYIELDKQASFPASSNVGKLILGVSTSNEVTITNSEGTTSVVGGGGTPLPYLEYISKISNVNSGLVKITSVLNNTLGINPVWVKTDEDYYQFKFNSAIDVDKAISNVPRIDDVDNYSNILNKLSVTNNFGNGFNGTVSSIAVQSDGKILVGGAFTGYSGTTANYIIRLFSDGSIDNTFNTGTGFNNLVFSIAIQSDDKILVGGAFTDYNGTTANNIIRLNTNGSIDNTFNTGTGFNGVLYSIVIQSDDKILVGGQFADYNGTTANYIIRLNSNGSVDNTFNTGTGFDDEVRSIAIQSDDKILVGGQFTDYNGTTANNIIRLNTDGSVDNTFNYGTGFDNLVYSIAIQSDGKILVGGEFTVYNGTGTNNIIRLNTDGSVDNTFNTGTGFDGTVLSIAIQSDGKILVGGQFTDYNGTGVNYIIRLSTDGSVDYDINYGTDFNSEVRSIAIQSDGNIMVGGAFTNGDFYGNYIRKINNEFIFYLYKADDILNKQPIEIRLYN